MENGFIESGGQAFRLDAIQRVFKLNGTLYAEIGNVQMFKPWSEKFYSQYHSIMIKDEEKQRKFCEKLGINYDKIVDVQKGAKTGKVSQGPVNDDDF